jgi:AraC-like DNA-binding protein
VISIYNETICTHLQRTEPNAQTLGVERQYFDSSKDQLLIRYLEELSEQFHGRDPRRHYAVKGLMMAYLSTLAEIINHSREAAPVEKLKISQAKRYVQEYLGSAELSVKQLAGLLHCSPDYLSHIFHRETGHRLIAYIHREQVAMNRSAIRRCLGGRLCAGIESQVYLAGLCCCLQDADGYRSSLSTRSRKKATDNLRGIMLLWPVSGRDLPSRSPIEHDCDSHAYCKRPNPRRNQPIVGLEAL